MKVALNAKKLATLLEKRDRDEDAHPQSEQNDARRMTPKELVNRKEERQHQQKCLMPVKMGP